MEHHNNYYYYYTLIYGERGYYSMKRSLCLISYNKCVAASSVTANLFINDFHRIMSFLLHAKLRFQIEKEIKRKIVEFS